jgi:dolichol-phosphate mannosyltransferase
MLSLILPTYNEAANLPELIPALEKLLKDVPHEIIVVDDNSPDETWKVGLELARSIDSFRVIRRVGRRGLSSAVIEGFLAAKGDTFVVMDADGQHDMSLIVSLYEATQKGNGIAIGSRYIEGGSVGEWDERRHMMSKVATRMALALCKVKVSDPMSGFFAITRETFEQALPKLNPKGFKILLDLLIHVPSDTTVKELPFTFSTRKHGESKLSRRVQIEFLEYLYEAALGRFIPLTFIKYCMVGLCGVIIHTSVYLLLAHTLLTKEFPPQNVFIIAMVAGLEAAIIFNFLLNNSWTFSHAKLQGWKAVTGFLKYNFACLFGAVAAYSVSFFLLQLGLELSGVAFGALIGTIWNYTMSRLLTWKAS